VVSRERVAAHGEVYTNAREVNAMLDLIPENACTHTARYLEPSCGTGNFLVEILARKLATLDALYLKTASGKVRKTPLNKNQTDYEANLVAVTGSLYGIELLADNVAVCRERLLSHLWTHYVQQFPTSFKGNLLDVLRFVLGKNIVHGDALAFTRQDAGFAYEAIVFCEWTLLPDYTIRRSDFRFEGLAMTENTASASDKQVINAQHMDNLFDEDEMPLVLPKALKHWPPTAYLALSDMEVNHAA
jgi:hypothetical protein